MVREATLKALVEVVAKVILNVFVFVFCLMDYYYKRQEKLQFNKMPMNLCLIYPGFRIQQDSPC